VSKNQNTGRIILNEEAKSSLLQMLESLKGDGEYLKITPSKLTSWVVNRYFITSFEKEKKIIEKDHFNSKGYLRNVLKGIEGEDDLEKALQTALARVNRTKNRPGRKRKEKTVTQRPEGSE